MYFSCFLLHSLDSQESHSVEEPSLAAQVLTRLSTIIIGCHSRENREQDFGSQELFEGRSISNIRARVFKHLFVKG